MMLCIIIIIIIIIFSPSRGLDRGMSRMIVRHNKYCPTPPVQLPGPAHTSLYVSTCTVLEKAADSKRPY